MSHPGAEIVLMSRDGGTVPVLPLWLRPIAPVLRTLRVGRLLLDLPDGRALRVEGAAEGPEAHLSLRRWNVLWRAATRGDVGLGEAYMAGDWHSDDLVGTLSYFAENTASHGEVYAPKGVSGRILATVHALRANTRFMARRNIAAHYDLGNAFYAAWLDEAMHYSSALFSDGASDLATAQTAKCRALISAMEIARGESVLEIGCGWGGFACVLAKETGCDVTGITLSPSQRAWAQASVADAKLDGQVDIHEQDYRDHRGHYDHVVSVEMIEAVGERYWRTYFEKVASLLDRGGQFGLQAITIRDAAFPDYRRTGDFLQTHIFPGGMLLPEKGMLQLASEAGLELVHQRAFGQDYARTLALWRTRFEAAWPEIERLGFDERFRRMWLFYLAICEAGFRSGLITVSQTVFRRA